MCVCIFIYIYIYILSEDNLPSLLNKHPYTSYERKQMILVRGVLYMSHEL